MSYHKLLDKQLKKIFPEETNHSPSYQKIFELISKTYQIFERDKELAEHAFNISEKEYQDSLKDIHIQSEIKSRSIEQIKEALKKLDEHAAIKLHHDRDELIETIDFLNEKINLAKQMEEDLHTAKDSAEKALKVKGEFLAVMSHEIRTPLNAITGITNLLANNEQLPSQTENLKILQISVENLMSLINDILDFSKMEEGKIELHQQPIDLIELISKIKAAHRVQADLKGNQIKMTMDLDLPRFINADDIRLAQILNNLISNAIKFTSNGIIHITTKVVNRTENAVEIFFSVSDTGIGIDPTKHQIIFEHFSQANSGITREFGGSGLGLSIVKHLLDLMGSSIHLKSEPGKGAEFSFAITFGKTQGSKEYQQVLLSKPKDLTGFKILLVEDLEFNILVAEKMIQNWNGWVSVARNGAEAVEWAMKEKFDLILMDLQMPIMDGFTATGEIRKFNKNIPIIALTAYNASEFKEKTKESGMDGYITKPFKPDEVLQTIHHALFNQPTRN